MSKRSETSTEILAREVPKGQKDGGCTSISVRPIDNGYLVCKSYSDNGSYSYKEEFSREKPDLEVGKAEARHGGSSLKAAAKYLRSKD